MEWGKTQFILLGITFSTEIKEMENLNIKLILSIISREIYNWRRRNITPIGKIAVTKTLLSKLNHILLILPNLNPSFINKIESLFYGYLWDDKPDKINRAYLNNTAKRINNSFWSEILQSYVSFINKIHSKNQTNLLSTPIRYNEDINNGNLYIPTLSKIGYNLICDFIDDTGQPLSH